MIASIVPTARFAQPIGALLFYPMVALSGLFIPVDVAAAGAAGCCRASLPLTYAVSLLQGHSGGATRGRRTSAMSPALVVVFVVCTALSARVFRWE